MRPWSVDFVKTVEKPLCRSPLRNAAYTAPVSATVSITGSYWAFEPRHVQRAVCGPKVEPPSEDVVIAMNGDGQWLVQPGGSTPYRVVSR